MCDYQGLVDRLHGFADAARNRSLTLGEVIDSLDGSAYAFISVILILPFFQPLPLGPFSTVGGLTFALLGTQLLRGHLAPVLPERIRAIALSEKTWRNLIGVTLKVMGFCRRLTRPRMQRYVTGSTGRQVCGCIMLVAGLLIAVPFPIPLPFNNALPGLAILFYCIGELEEDGMMVFVSLFWILATLAYFSAYFIGIWLFGTQALHALF